MTYVRCKTLSLKVDYIAVTSSLRLEDALTRAKLIFALRASNISWQPWQKMEFVVQTLDALYSTKACYVFHP